MHLTVLGGSGGWPAADRACSGYLIEHDGFQVLVDPGYAVVPKLLQLMGAEDIDAVLVSHGHPDHCADINPLLRVRTFQDRPPPPLPLFAPAEALDAVLALDRPSMLGTAGATRKAVCGRLERALKPGDQAVAAAQFAAIEESDFGPTTRASRRGR